ncbi:2,3,4,5-tetrahydropyridine-2,6-dicarboxylate N-succinyltransferase [Buchnera aphidicola]|uniref:2,3,4,5-tetrahydropyridine-2,6-dicarboxylate N-succinyltransferase n=1 Tax=Buchnera aphidicola (Sarucallis kahawaluokalani) TaxID=1241878 RepID=A0A4D6YLV5_9GAMM|nr:2,3,4,5-tetrahydropyridine-2,6-dicarboxylate N-succinyltransferase [Buchnera aphidicola]QCI25955.1 2,3,4,5-tetrahydropyridine-2,6-dicarboxylate N-succinyltransferase [Buchnera aphidicola (Sarucallis kahawaluokalani)]
MKELKKIIDQTFENRDKINHSNINSHTYNAIEKTIKLIDCGILKISEKISNQWITHQWLKKAILLYFCIKKNIFFSNSKHTFYDKIDLKYQHTSEEELKKNNIRIVPPATVRKGAFIAQNTILMPSYINIGAYINEGTMIDTWSTVGSCAYIGKNVHLSGGVGIGGVLEPIQNNPTIIEDNCFIGARSEIVEGVIVEQGSVISMGVYIGQSTKIYNRQTGEITYGRIPAGSVVVSGTLPSENKKYNLYCAVIVKKVNTQTLKKIEINQLLRNIT